jgi:hypothetical protein
VLLPHGLIEDRIEKLAADIRNDLPGVTPHLLVVLKGGSEFATDLTRALRKKHSYSGSTHLPFTVDYIRVKSYEGTESTGNGERRGALSSEGRRGGPAVPTEAARKQALVLTRPACTPPRCVSSRCWLQSRCRAST